MKSAVEPLNREEMDRLIEVSKEDDFFYMFFMVAKTTGRRLGEFYGVQVKEKIGEKKDGNKTRKVYDKEGNKIIIPKMIPIIKNTKEWQYGVQVKDIDFNRNIMRVWVLKRRNFTQDETILLPEVSTLIRDYVHKHNLKQWNYLFRKRSYRHIQYMVNFFAKKAGITKKVSPHCVSEDTECLTLEGWKKYTELKVGEKIFSYNIKKDCIEFDKIKELNVFEHKGEMYNFKNTYLDFLVSENHKMPLNISHSKQINNIRISSIWDGLKLIEVKELLDMKNKRVVLHKISCEKYNGKLSIGLSKAGILGWILSDAHISKKGDVTIFQSLSANPEKCKIIEDILNKSGIRFNIKIQKPRKTTFNEDSQIVVYRIIDKEWIYDWINKDRTPKNKILLLKKEELEIIFKMIMLGDGCRDREYCSQNINRIDFIQTLCLFIGRRCLRSNGLNNRTNKPKHRTWISENDSVQIIPEKHIKKIKYKGNIWCPTTKNGTWIARRNNKTFITGNSFRHHFITGLLKQGWHHNQIAKLTGHKSIGTVMIYDHVIAEDLKEKALPDIRNL